MGVLFFCYFTPAWVLVVQVASVLACQHDGIYYGHVGGGDFAIATLVAVDDSAIITV